MSQAADGVVKFLSLLRALETVYGFFLLGMILSFLELASIHAMLRCYYLDWVRDWKVFGQECDQRFWSVDVKY